MTFQQNVRATFSWRHFSKNASLVALAVTFGVSEAIVSVPSQDVVLAYGLLLLMVVDVGLVFYLTTNPPVNLFRGTNPWWQLREIWKPILLGVVIVLGALVAVLAAFGFPLAANSWQQNLRNVVLFAAWVGFVEEYMRWTWLQVLPYGVLTANVLWVLLHPEVAPILNGQAWSPFFAVFALTFGFAMTALMWYGDKNPWLGPILAATLHAGYNSLVFIWQVELVVPSSGPTTFGPMSAPAWAWAGTISILCVVGPWVIRTMKRGRRSSRPRGVPGDQAV